MSWEKFLGEIKNACKEKDVAYEDLKRWIYETIPNVEKIASAFHVSIGPTPKFQDLLVDVHILTGSILHEFTVKEGKDEYNIYQPKAINTVQQTTSQGVVEFRFLSSGSLLFTIEIEEKYLDNTRRFVHQVVTTWE